ncbi:hypothetical protein HanIR_Chr05g0249471 [Helianthus annuus]|nr:hypothetical protein HanIR_Chr05g0249471 [Helianthus annuus]
MKKINSKLTSFSYTTGGFYINVFFLRSYETSFLRDNHTSNVKSCITTNVLYRTINFVLLS